MNEGWHLLRGTHQQEEFIWRVVYCSFTGSGQEKHVDILHEAYGCKRVKYNHPLKDIRVIPISIEKAMQ